MTWNNYGYMTKEQKLALEQLDADRKALHAKILDDPRWKIHLIRAVATHEKYEVIEKGAEAIQIELGKGAEEEEALTYAFDVMHQHNRFLRKQRGF